MFLPALEEKIKREREQQEHREENRLHLPDLQQQYEEYLKNKQEQEKEPERVITIQIM
jgi:hypothetical protein